MVKILVEVSIGELLDKISILDIKKDKINDLSKLKFIKYEYDILKKEYDNKVKNDEKLIELYEKRKYAYSHTAHYTIDVNKMNSKVAITKILTILKNG